MHIPQLDSYERQPLDQNTLALLCDFAVGDPQHPLRQVDANWQNVYEGVCHNGLVGLVYTYLALHEPTNYPSPAFREAVNHTYRLLALRMAMLYRSVVMVLTHLNEIGIDYMVVKGPAAAHTLYPVPASRNFNDLDLIVHERDWCAIHRILTDMGFEQKQNLPEPPPKIAPQAAVADETVYWNQNLGLKIDVHYDDILNSGLSSRDAEGFWERGILIEVQGVKFKTLSLEDQLIHLCTHLHYHGYVKLNWFADLILLVQRHGERLNWQRLIATVQVEEAQVPVYYTLYFLERKFGVRVPTHVMEKLRPRLLRRWLHDWYMPPEKILSFQPTSRPDFSFYFIPLYKRMLPDLLVMGRRREKINYLLHLLVPPGDWLQFYYHFQDRRWLPLHYLLHPLRLFGVYVRETIQLVVTRQYVDLNIKEKSKTAMTN
jgi:hypothetical protein